MEGTLSEIRIFAGDYAPKNWMLCLGQQLSINTNQALFALLGTIYGGNGTTTFQLPDFAGRIPVGLGSAAGGKRIELGVKLGLNEVVLNTNNMPAHSHIPMGETAAIKAYSEGGNSSSPTNNFLASMHGMYTNTNPPDTVLRPVSNTFAVIAAGKSKSIDIRQPYLGVNYIICTMGIFPSRN